MEPIAFLLLPGFSAIAFFSALEPLRIANRLAGKTLYRWTIHAPEGDHAEASNGMRIRADGPLAARAQTLVVCAGFDPLRLANPPLLAALRRVWRLGGSLGAIDTGAFILAEAGILGEDAITLHWEAADEFIQRYPRTPVSDELFERHARLFTCAGGTAAMDMMLDAIAADHGPALARAVSDQLIHERIRPANEPQRTRDPVPADPLIRRIVRLMEGHIETPLPLAALARLAGADRRRIERRFRKVLGQPPARFYRELRLQRGLALIQDHETTVQQAASASGYSSPAVFSRACRNRYGKSPRAMARSA